MTDRMKASTDDGNPGAHVTTVSFTVPTWVVAGLKMSPEAFACWLRVAAAMFRYGRSELSLGTAAALAGMSQAEFMRALKEVGQDTFVIDWDDLDRELTYLAGQRRPNEAGG